LTCEDIRTFTSTLIVQRMPNRGRYLIAYLCADWHAHSRPGERTGARPTVGDVATSFVTGTRQAPSEACLVTEREPKGAPDARFSRRRVGREFLAGVARRRRPEPVSSSCGAGTPPPGSRAQAADRRRGEVPRSRATATSARRHVVARDLRSRQAGGRNLVQGNLI
jgi:hypothetical protein